jgi:hypothetical protein
VATYIEDEETSKLIEAYASPTERSPILQADIDSLYEYLDVD